MTIQKLTNHDLYLTLSWGNVNHGICGHTFEIIEYYLLLKDYFNIGIFLCEYNKDIIYQCLQKYDITEDIKQELLNNTIFNIDKKPKIIYTKNLLVVDGGSKNLNNVTFFCNNLLAFSCQNPYDKRFKYLHDIRIYPNSDLDIIDYKKKIYFDIFKNISHVKNNTLLYGTSNCRPISTTYLKNLDPNKNYILVTNTYYDTPLNVTIYNPPVDNLFELFDTYIYTSVPRVWDCSPRFLAECKYYNKKIVFDIDYDIKQDLGLYYRMHDIDNDFDNICLTHDDQIIDILKGIL